MLLSWRAVSTRRRWPLSWPQSSCSGPQTPETAEGQTHHSPGRAEPSLSVPHCLGSESCRFWLALHWMCVISHMYFNYFLRDIWSFKPILHWQNSDYVLVKWRDDVMIRPSSGPSVQMFSRSYGPPAVTGARVRVHADHRLRVPECIPDTPQSVPPEYERRIFTGPVVTNGGSYQRGRASKHGGGTQPPTQALRWFSPDSSRRPNTPSTDHLFLGRFLALFTHLSSTHLFICFGFF